MHKAEMCIRDSYYNGDLLEAVVKTLGRIQGAYALGILCSDCPDRLIAVRKDSPLILGFGQGAHYLASDVTALIKYTREVCYLDDGEIAELTPCLLYTSPTDCTI